MELLKTYLPPELTDEELESGLREIIASTGAQSKKDMGKVMKDATARFKGRADGKKIQEVVSFFQRHDPAIEQIARARLLTSKVVDQKDAAVRLHLKRRFVKLGRRIVHQIEMLQQQFTTD